MKRSECLKVFRWFKKEVGLAGWSLKLYLKECPTTISGSTPHDEVGSYYGLSQTSLPYHEISVWINPALATSKAGDISDWRATLMHELTHGAFHSIGIESNPLHEHFIDRVSHQLAGQYCNGKANRSRGETQA